MSAAAAAEAVMKKARRETGGALCSPMMPAGIVEGMLEEAPAGSEAGFDMAISG